MMCCGMIFNLRAADVATKSGEVKIIAITASHPKGTEKFAIDNDLTTRWGINGKGKWIQLELDQPTEVSTVAIAWFRGGLRKGYFDVAVSTNGTSWNQVITDGESSGISRELEVYSFKPQMAKYIKITFNGNSTNGWVSIYEVKVNMVAKKTLQKSRIVKVGNVSASATTKGVSPELASDGDMLTRWEVKGKGNWLQLDLEKAVSIDTISIFWFKGKQRQAFFDLELSMDGKTWQTVIGNGKGSGKTVGFEIYEFKAQTAKFVRIVVNGNSINSWASIYEVNVYAAKTI